MIFVQIMMIYLIILSYNTQLQKLYHNYYPPNAQLSANSDKCITFIEQL